MKHFFLFSFLIPRNILLNPSIINLKKVAGDIHLSKPSFIDGKYDNPWSTWKIPSFMDVLRWKLFGTDHTNLPKDVKVL